jgi:hypothetical protein
VRLWLKSPILDEITRSHWGHSKLPALKLFLWCCYWAEQLTTILRHSFRSAADSSHPTAIFMDFIVRCRTSLYLYVDLLACGFLGIGRYKVYIFQACYPAYLGYVRPSEGATATPELQLEGTLPYWVPQCLRHDGTIGSAKFGADVVAEYVQVRSCVAYRGTHVS